MKAGVRNNWAARVGVKAASLGGSLSSSSAAGRPTAPSADRKGATRHEGPGTAPPPRLCSHLFGSCWSCLFAHPVPSLGTITMLGSFPLFSDFKLGRFAGGGMRRAVATFPRLCKPCLGITAGREGWEQRRTGTSRRERPGPCGCVSHWPVATRPRQKPGGPPADTNERCLRSPQSLPKPSAEACGAQARPGLRRGSPSARGQGRAEGADDMGEDPGPGPSSPHGHFSGD